MLFRKLITVFLTVICFGTMVLAQNKMYLEYNNDCMTRMEYKAMGSTNGGNLVHYYAYDNENTKLILELRKASEVRLATRPGYMVPCSKVNYNEALMQQCNTGALDLYVVSRDKNGYVANYVESISLLKDNGRDVSFSSFTYGFQYPKNGLDPTINFAANTNADDIMYRGETGYNCLNNYTFRQTTKNTCGSYTDITFNPKLGILKTTEFENPQFTNGSNNILKDYQLVYINNLPVDNYLGSYCQGRIPTDPTLYVAPPTFIPDEFTSRGETVVSTAPVIAAAPKPTVPKPTPPRPVVKPKTSDFTNGIAAGSAHGEPIAPLKNYISECNAYKKPGFHIVRPRENLYSISRMTGVPVSNLIEWNDISNKELIPACSELRLVPPTPDMYEALTTYKQPTIVTETAKKKIIEKKVAEDLQEKGESKKVNKKPSDKAPLQIEGTHIVQDGETLYSIAKLYGYTSEKFMEINGLEEDIISPNMVLKTTDCACEIPDDYTPKGGDIPKEFDVESKVVKEDILIHKLSNGETLYKISKKYGVSVERIMLLNGIKDPTDLSVNQELRIK